ncbi:MAG TPA: transglutaminase family protein [Candidatus Binataceae bacterium]|jgi:transglutaminase-like putative cysteine protease
MSTLTIKHITTYRYKNPVAFGEHRMMLRPLSSDDQSVIAAELKITPTPTSIREIQDAFGNHVNIARFAGRAKELRFESAVRVKHTQADIRDFQIEEFARTYPFNYRAQELLALARYMQRNPMDVDRQVDEWARTVVSKESATDTRELLINLTHRINGGFKHVRRDEKGIQTPGRTLELRSGSCRDLAMLMIDVVRSLGIAARFVSGYLHIPSGDDESYAGGGNTHAWAQVHLPGPGWVDFDPSNGIIGNRDLVRVAAVPDPRDAIPLHGTWMGLATDYLGMKVEVAVSSAA